MARPAISNGGDAALDNGFLIGLEVSARLAMVGLSRYFSGGNPPEKASFGNSWPELLPRMLP
jgi:hypothetical protein